MRTLRADDACAGVRTRGAYVGCSSGPFAREGFYIWRGFDIF